MYEFIAFLAHKPLLTALHLTQPPLMGSHTHLGSALLRSSRSYCVLPLVQRLREWQSKLLASKRGSDGHLMHYIQHTDGGGRIYAYRP
jgi:hypothetical protein